MRHGYVISITVPNRPVLKYWHGFRSHHTRIKAAESRNTGSAPATDFLANLFAFDYFRCAGGHYDRAGLISR